MAPKSPLTLAQKCREYPILSVLFDELIATLTLSPVPDLNPESWDSLGRFHKDLSSPGLQQEIWRPAYNTLLPVTQGSPGTGLSQETPSPSPSSMALPILVLSDGGGGQMAFQPVGQGQPAVYMQKDEVAPLSHTQYKSKWRWAKICMKKLYIHLESTRGLRDSRASDNRM